MFEKKGSLVLLGKLGKYIIVCFGSFCKILSHNNN